MTWSAPEITRTDPPNTGDERILLDGWLDFHRQTLLMKCAGLTADQLKRRSVEPSGMSLLGLVRHLTQVERAWFRWRVAGEDIPLPYSPTPASDADFDEAESADAEQDYAAYLREIEAARAAVAGRPLAETFFHSRRQAEMSVRWVYLHMIEEYARHNGHADLLRERIDGESGA